MEDQREKDIQELCRQVLDIAPHYSSSSSYNAKENDCPFCYNSAYWDEGMDEIKHESNCAYLIAKDLSTNLNNQPKIKK